MRQNTCVIYDLETKDPGSVYLSVTTRYEINFGDQTLDPETEAVYVKAKNWFESIDWSGVVTTVVIAAVFIVAAGLAAAIFAGAVSGLLEFLLSLIACFFA